MLLQRLVELQGRGSQGPAMYQPTRVAWTISLDGRGKLLGFVPLTGSGKKAKDGREMPAPTLVRSVAIKPKLLCDNGEYVLGVAKGEDRGGKVAQRHEAFVALARRCAEETREPGVEAVVAFLDAWSPEDGGLPAEFDANATLTFEVDGVLPIELPSVQRFWASHTREAGGGAQEEATCLVCGERKPPEKRHPKKIRGVPGGQTSGTSMISANSDAFESYGLEASLVAPTCRECAEGFADALNGLLADEKSRVYLGPVVHAFWTKQGAPEDILNVISNPSPDEVAVLLRAPTRGRDASDVAKVPDFFMVSLSASGGRVVVRDYLETSLAAVQKSLARWFRMQRAGEEKQPLGLYALGMALAHDKLDELSPSLLSSLMRVALSGGPMPEGILQLLARRNRAEGGPTRPRAALARMTLVSNPRHGYTEDQLMALEPQNESPAYQCGRLFAELANAQRAALGDTNSTIVDRYYGTASSAPATVFGTLLRGSQTHLAKLRQEKPGAHFAIEQRIGEIAARLPTFPPTLSLPEQALFSLGYYHQKAANDAQRRQRSEAKKARDAENGNEGDDAE